MSGKMRYSRESTITMGFLQNIKLSGHIFQSLYFVCCKLQFKKFIQFLLHKLSSFTGKNAKINKKKGEGGNLDNHINFAKL